VGHFGCQRGGRIRIARCPGAEGALGGQRLAVGPEVTRQLAAFAKALVVASAAGDRGATVLIGNWARDLGDELASTAPLTAWNAELIVARDHG
jgi:hypothetical protein